MLGKILLLVAAFWVLLTLVKRYRKSLEHPATPSSAAQDMVRCHTCGLHLPKAEGIFEHGEYYCCAEHSRHRRD